MQLCRRHTKWLEETYFPEDFPHVLDTLMAIHKERLTSRYVNPYWYGWLNPRGCPVCMESEEIMVILFDELRAEAAEAEKDACEENDP